MPLHNPHDYGDLDWDNDSSNSGSGYSNSCGSSSRSHGKKKNTGCGSGSGPRIHQRPTNRSGSTCKDPCDKECPNDPENLFLSRYVVDECGCARYTDLDAAVCDANKDPSEGPVTIFLREGNYHLPEELSTSRSINIIGVGFGGNATSKVTGRAVSYGNKGWEGVEFAGSCSKYTLSDPKKCAQGKDIFRFCKFTDNFKVKTNSNTLVFRDCDFDYHPLSRNAVIKTGSCGGSIMAHCCNFTFCRSAATCSNVSSFVHLGSNDSCPGSKSVFKDCFVSGMAVGDTTFSVFSIVGIQPVVFDNGEVDITVANPNTYVFGNTNFTKDITLTVTASTFNGYNQNNLALMGNLWSTDDENTDGIVFQGCIINKMRMMWYIMPPTERRQPRFFFNDILHFPSNRSSFEILVDMNVNLFLNLHSVDIHSVYGNNLIVMTQLTAGTNTATISTALSSFNLNNPAGLPTWLLKAIDIIVVTQNGTSLLNYNVVTTIVGLAPLINVLSTVL